MSEDKQQKNPVGRPTKYEPLYADHAKKLCMLGATDKDLAAFFEVAESTINKWKNEHPKFSESINEAKTEADAKVVKSLFQRATGYKHPDIHFSSHQGEVTATEYDKHYAPDTVACIFWLKNRQKENWRDKQEHDLTSGGEKITPQIVLFGKATNDNPQ